MLVTVGRDVEPSQRLVAVFDSGAGHKNKNRKKRLHMRKPEVAAAIAEKADITKDQAKKVLDAILEEITGALHRKESVTLVGFGTFLQRHRGARTGKNPQTGEPVKIKASNTVAFKPGKSLKDSVNP
ncbi:putative Integration host factor, beta subunit [Pseudomonas coronafaciens pv. zizaniae]|nr:putative Integration host factor, beta subunit [Pseudomonas coronafaciens pv. zizaniae]